MSTNLIDNEPSVTDYRRSVADYDAADPDDATRELTLSTPAILGIFFALAIVCACFFGLGYAMGRRSFPTGSPAVFDSATAPGTSAAKPAAGQRNLPPDAAALTTPDAPSASSAASSAQSSAQTVAVPLGASAPPALATPTTSAQTGAAAAPAAPAGFVVQVAAVSSQDVAAILVTSLEKKGYIVAVRPGVQDSLLHVQIGPFADRAAAEATRQRVLADGFNAIVK